MLGTRELLVIGAAASLLYVSALVSIVVTPDRDASQPPSPPAGAAGAAPSSGRPATPVPACASDWQACADNHDMATHHTGWRDVLRACQDETNYAARFGQPDWGAPDAPFPTYAAGRDFPRTGRVTVVEPNVRFQDGLGGYIDAEVRCSYDLSTAEVTALAIDER